MRVTNAQLRCQSYFLSLSFPIHPRTQQHLYAQGQILLTLVISSGQQHPCQILSSRTNFKGALVVSRGKKSFCKSKPWQICQFILRKNCFKMFSWPGTQGLNYACDTILRLGILKRGRFYQICNDKRANWQRRWGQTNFVKWFLKRSCIEQSPSIQRSVLKVQKKIPLT